MDIAIDVTGTHSSNAKWWNETAAWYGEAGISDDIEFLRCGGTSLFESERRLLGDLSGWCQRAVHLQCSHGRDALSLLTQGAHEVVGIDISTRLIAVAKQKAQALGANAIWINSDILETPHDLDGTADLVYTGRGAICWMMDIEAWACVAARLLKPNGLFFIHESHPIDWVWDTSAARYALDAEDGDYFSTNRRSHLFSHATETSPQYRNWTVAQIINSLIGAGLAIERMEEYPEPFWDQFSHMPAEMLHRLPHAFALTARKG